MEVEEIEVIKLLVILIEAEVAKPTIEIMEIKVVEMHVEQHGHDDDGRCNIFIGHANDFQPS